MQHEAAIHVAADHPAFDGHFPGAPVLPGAMLLALVIDALPAGRLAPRLTVEQMKFMQPVRPGAMLVVRFTLDAPRGVPFEVRLQADESLVAKGQLSRVASA